MNRPTLRYGCRGDEVKELQKILKEKGYLESVDGIFGNQTKEAVSSFQRDSGEVSDGIVGKHTWSVLLGSQASSWRLIEKDYEWAAEELQCEVAAIKAVSEVESAGDGFLDVGIPKILFERHWMFKKLEEEGLMTALKLGEKYLPNIVKKQSGGYQGGWAEWDRFNKAYGLNHEAAIESTSWGRFQIMGFHWERLGYESAEHFRYNMESTERDHLEAFVQFIKSAYGDRLVDAIREKDWSTFSRVYNGPQYKRNLYDTRMADAYERMTK